MKLQFESTTACNAKCTFCPRYDMTRPMGQMSDKLFHKIIQESKVFGRPEIVPFLNGEPFCFPKIWEWLDYMRDNECRVYLFTNAELMDVDRIVKYKNIRYICCSINAATKETHKAIMRGPDFDVVEKRVRDLIDKAPFPVYVSMVEVEKNQHEVGDFRKKWGKHVTHGEFKNWGGAVHDKLERSGERTACLAFLRTITILWDGRVVPCCMDYNGTLILGDANKQTLLEILTASQWFKNLQCKLDFSMEPCKNCNHNIK